MEYYDEYLYGYEEDEKYEEEERKLRGDVAQRMLDHWRDLCARPGGTIVHQPPSPLPPDYALDRWRGGRRLETMFDEHGLSAFDEQAVNLFLDLCASSPPTIKGSKSESSFDDDDERHYIDDRDVAKRQSYWRMRGLLAWVFATRGRDACLSFLDDNDNDDDEDDEDDKRDKLALFSWLGPSLSKWLREYRFRYSLSNAFMHVVQRLPQAWRMLRACMSTTMAATTTPTSDDGATASHHRHQTRLTRAHLEHVTKVLIACLRWFIRTHTRGTMRGACAIHTKPSVGTHSGGGGGGAADSAIVGAYPLNEVLLMLMLMLMPLLIFQPGTNPTHTHTHHRTRTRTTAHAPPHMHMQMRYRQPRQCWRWPWTARQT
jgi:hypothetical protein